MYENTLAKRKAVPRPLGQRSFKPLFRSLYAPSLSANRTFCSKYGSYVVNGLGGFSRFERTVGGGYDYPFKRLFGKLISGERDLWFRVRVAPA